MALVAGLPAIVLIKELVLGECLAARLVPQPLEACQRHIRSGGSFRTLFLFFVRTPFKERLLVPRPG